MFIIGLIIGFMIGYIVKSVTTWKDKVKETFKSEDEE